MRARFDIVFLFKYHLHHITIWGIFGTITVPLQLSSTGILSFFCLILNVILQTIH